MHDLGLLVTHHHKKEIDTRPSCQDCKCMESHGVDGMEWQELVDRGEADW
jgi:hypothetical protein